MSEAKNAETKNGCMVVTVFVIIFSFVLAFLGIGALIEFNKGEELQRKLEQTEKPIKAEIIKKEIVEVRFHMNEDGDADSEILYIYVELSDMPEKEKRTFKVLTYDEDYYERKKGDIVYGWVSGDDFVIRGKKANEFPSVAVIVAAAFFFLLGISMFIYSRIYSTEKYNLNA